MSQSETEHTHTVVAQDNSGRSYTIQRFEEFVISQTRGGTSRNAVAVKFRTADGQSVNYISKGKYKIVGFGLEVTSDDPNAP